MSKLHEILAVETDRESAANAVILETSRVFTGKPDHFLGKHSVYKPWEEGAQDDEEVTKELVTTVHDKLQHMFSIVAKAVDVTATKDLTNTTAKADILIADKVILKDVPAVTLLMLESRLKKWREVFLSIPTLAPGVAWVPNTSRGKHIWQNPNPERKFRTRKVPKSKILVEASQHHPAQVAQWNEDEKIGETVHTEWSSMMSPTEKSELIARTDELIMAVKEARMRANMEPVKQASVAGALISYLLG